MVFQRGPSSLNLQQDIKKVDKGPPEQEKSSSSLEALSSKESSVEQQPKGISEANVIHAVVESSEESKSFSPTASKTRKDLPELKLAAATAMRPEKQQIQQTASIPEPKKNIKQIKKSQIKYQEAPPAVNQDNRFIRLPSDK